MKLNKNDNMKMSSGNINGNEIANQTQTRESPKIHSPNPDPNQLNLNLVKHRQNSRHKFAPFTKSQRRKRRTEVYKLHFEHGMPATRIAEIMNVDRNTINNDLKFLYQKSLNEYNPDNMSLDDIVEKQLLRLETQRDRLGLYLCDVKDVNTKIAIERLVSDIDFKLIGAIEKVNHNSSRFWDELLKGVNKVAEIKKLDVRYTSLFELRKISIDSRKNLNELREEAFKEKKLNNE